MCLPVSTSKSQKWRWQTITPLSIWPHSLSGNFSCGQAAR